MLLCASGPVKIVTWCDCGQQVDVFAQKIKADKNLVNGFNCIGFSQGNSLCRGYIQKYNNPPVITFLSVHGTVSGVSVCWGGVCWCAVCAGEVHAATPLVLVRLCWGGARRNTAGIVSAVLAVCRSACRPHARAQCAMPLRLGCRAPSANGRLLDSHTATLLGFLDLSAKNLPTLEEQQRKSAQIWIPVSCHAH